MTAGLIEFKVDQRSLARLQAKIRDRRTKVGRTMAVTADPVEHFTQYIGIRVALEARRRAPSDTGALRRSIGFIFAENAGQVRVESPYGMWVHEGTRPHWPPPQATAGWALRHGIPNFLVGRAISERGTRPQRFLLGAFDRVIAKDVAPGLQKFASEVATGWAKK
jgi:hypothetical protein